MDMQRTYLGHYYFHEQEARDSLYKICKAYSIYDEEVGYCQGLSFIIAVLLLQVSKYACTWGLLPDFVFCVRYMYCTCIDVLHSHYTF